MRKNKQFTVNDLIIFLKAKIAIILFSTFLLSAIACFYQVSYKNHLEIEISRTVDINSLMETIMLIKNQSETNSKKYNTTTSSINQVTLMREVDNLINILMINYLSNNNIVYSGFVNSKSDVNLLKKKYYKLIIPNTDNKSEDVLKYNFDKFINDTKKLTRDIIKIQYDLDPTYNLDIYNFKIIKTLRVDSYDYTQILKIILINLIVSIFFIFIFHIRKAINLF
jgi:hypothetical protein